MSSLRSLQTGSSSLLLLIVLLLLGAILLQNGYQTYQILDDGDRLRARINAQEAAVQDAQKVRAQLLSIAGQTAALADGGNANARVLIERLQAQGVTIRAPGQNP
jgi:hypothetical protein